MSASPEFFKPSGAPAFSTPACATPLVFGDGYDDGYDCRTPTGNRISYLSEATTCPPAPRKPPPPPPPCRKRRLLFQGAQLQAAGGQQPAAESSSSSSSAVVVPLISLRLDELERLFRPHPPTITTHSRRRRSISTCSSVVSSANRHCAA